MELWASLVVVFCWVVTLVGQVCFATIKVGGPEGARKMTFKTPKLTDEEAHSNFVPEQLRCDACRIVAYQVRP